MKVLSLIVSLAYCKSLGVRIYDNHSDAILSSEDGVAKYNTFYDALMEGVIEDEGSDKFLRESKTWERQIDDKAGKYKKVYEIRYTNEEDLKLDKAINLLHEKTCVRFNKITNAEAEKIKKAKEETYIKFVNSEEYGCSENIGRVEIGEQKQKMATACLMKDGKQNVSMQLHYFMHILGFDNEHIRNDLSEYFKNVGEHYLAKTAPKYKNRRGHNFPLKLLNKKEMKSLNEESGPYDPTSVMHWTTDSSRGYLESKTDKVIPHMRLGENNPLSEIDINKINKAYPCEEVASKKPEDECTIEVSPKNTKERLPERCMKEVGQKIKIIADTTDDEQIKDLTINCKKNIDNVATEQDQPAAVCDREFESKQLNDVCVPLAGAFESKNLIKKSVCGLRVEGEHTLKKLSVNNVCTVIATYEKCDSNDVALLAKSSMTSVFALLSLII